MQQQPHRALCAPLSPASTETASLAPDLRSAPVELDLETLEHVAGGDGEALPKKYW